MLYIIHLKIYLIFNNSPFTYPNKLALPPFWQFSQKENYCLWHTFYFKTGVFTPIFQFFALTILREVKSYTVYFVGSLCNKLRDWRKVKLLQTNRWLYVQSFTYRLDWFGWFPTLYDSCSRDCLRYYTLGSSLNNISPT